MIIVACRYVYRFLSQGFAILSGRRGRLYVSLQKACPPSFRVIGGNICAVVAYFASCLVSVLVPGSGRHGDVLLLDAAAISTRNSCYFYSKQPLLLLDAAFDFIRIGPLQHVSGHAFDHVLPCVGLCLRLQLINGNEEISKLV